MDELASKIARMRRPSVLSIATAATTTSTCSADNTMLTSVGFDTMKAVKPGKTVDTPAFRVLPEGAVVIANPTPTQKRVVLQAVSMSGTATIAQQAQVSLQTSDGGGIVHAGVYVVRLTLSDFERCTRLTMQQQMKHGLAVLKHNVACFRSWKRNHIRNVIKHCQVR